MLYSLRDLLDEGRGGLDGGLVVIGLSGGGVRSGTTGSQRDLSCVKIISRFQDFKIFDVEGVAVSD